MNLHLLRGGARLPVLVLWRPNLHQTSFLNPLDLHRNPLEFSDLLCQSVAWKTTICSGEAPVFQSLSSGVPTCIKSPLFNTFDLNRNPPEFGDLPCKPAAWKATICPGVTLSSQSFSVDVPMRHTRGFVLHNHKYSKLGRDTCSGAVSVCLQERPHGGVRPFHQKST